jgi:hypothetical protein
MQRADVDGVLHEFAAFTQIRMLAEHLAQRTALVVVADEQVVGHRERLKQRFQMAVFLDASEVDEIPGNHNRLGARHKRIKTLDTANEMRGGVHAPIGERARALDVQIADLSQQHLEGVL